MHDSGQLLVIERLKVMFDTEDGTVNALKGISLSINRGEILALVGESGSGKSVTAMSVLGLLPPKSARITHGSINLFEKGGASKNLLDCPPEELAGIRGKRISMIFQEPMTSLNPLMTCGEQVAEVLRTHTALRQEAARQRTMELFDLVKLPDPASISKKYPHQLSGGQKQRVMIAIAMSCEPELLIADEPTTALDVTVQQNILSLISELQKEKGLGVLFITHDLGIVSDIADKVVVMYRGDIVESGDTRSVLSNPSHPYTRALLACRPMLHPPGARLPVVSDFMTNQPAEIIPAGRMNRLSTQDKSIPPAPQGSTFLSVRNLRVNFPRPGGGPPMSAVDGVSFDIKTGEILGLVGESGCGKTSLGRSLLGLVPAAEGCIMHEDTDLLKLNERAWKPIRKKFQIIFQDPFGSLNPRIRVGQAIAEPMQVHGIYPDRSERRDRVIDLLEKVGLQPEHYDRYPHEFSGGQRQRIGIARALALNPAFLVMDESVSALDVSVQAQVLNLIADLRPAFGFSALFISHDLSVIRHTCDRIMVMRQGRIIETGMPREIFEKAETEYTRTLIRAIPGKEIGMNCVI
jgi:peptide/nickel transport system ATP-binding protein